MDREKERRMARERRIGGKRGMVGERVEREREKRWDMAETSGGRGKRKSWELGKMNTWRKRKHR